MLGRFLRTLCRAFLSLSIKTRTLPASASDRQTPNSKERIKHKAPLCRMLLSVCMKDYVARSYGHTPRKLPLKGVPLRATSRFIAYQALLLYTTNSILSREMQKILKKYFIK